MEKQVRSHRVFEGNLPIVRSDQVELPDGRQSTREVVEHPGAVAVLPVTPEGNFLLVEHFRYPISRTLLEIPAGTREEGESPVATAHRELAEETGYRAGSMTEIARFYSSPGWATEEIVLFRAETLSETGHGFDHDEILNVVELKPDRIPVLMRDGTIADAKTIIALQLARTHPE